MLNFVTKAFRRVVEALLWINLVGSAIGGLIAGAVVGANGSIQLIASIGGFIGGFVVGLFVDIIVGGCLVTFIEIKNDLNTVRDDLKIAKSTIFNLEATIARNKANTN